MLAGARFALVRDAFLAQRRAKPSQITGVPVVTAFMGGTDPGGVIVQVVGEIAGLGAPFDLTVVAPASHHAGVTELFPTARVIEPTPELPALLGSSDVIVSAAGTSAWDVCTLAIPALFVGVVDNQSASLVRLVEGGYALGVDLAAGGSIDSVGPAVTRLLADTALREELSKRCESQFDGLGKARVVDALTAATESANAARLPR
jgi:spore coat polysaccharide biosynthesis predicted glycosyltransferase SpsG